MSELAINVECCRRRQKRLLAEMQRKNVDLVIVQAAEHVQWLTGPRFAWLVQAAVMLSADGRCTLIAPQEEPVIAAERTLKCVERLLGAPTR
jgi:Xaa-Pro aminopeptidase